MVSKTITIAMILWPEAVTPYGLTHYDVHGVFNFFMNVSYDDSGRMIIKPPIANNLSGHFKTGQQRGYMDVRAEMDVLGAIAACPGDINPTNGEDRVPKRLKIEIYEKE